MFGTGFDLCLPFLSDEIRAILDLDAVHLDADRYTFHPDLPGLAFMGMWDQSGGYFVPLELQARWIAYTWGGAIPAITESRPAVGDRRVSARRGTPQKTRMNLAALTFARAAGRRAAPGQLAGAAPRPAVRSPGAELFPARGPGCPARRGRGSPRCRPLRCDHVKRHDRARTEPLVATASDSRWPGPQPSGISTALGAGRAAPHNPTPIPMTAPPRPISCCERLSS